MLITVLLFFRSWIIMYCTCIHVTSSSSIFNRQLNDTEVTVVDLKTGNTGPVTYDLESWLSKQRPAVINSQNLTIIPILALIAFLWMVCLRICGWIREDSKLKERGCSYDVTSYVILTQEDKEFEALSMSSSQMSNFLYDTMSSSRSPQNQIDNKMYDTVTSYTSILRQHYLKNARSSTPDKTLLDSSNLFLHKKGRFQVIPVIDNYIRLKNRSKPDIKTLKIKEVKCVNNMKNRNESPSLLLSDSTHGKCTTRDCAVQVGKCSSKQSTLALSTVSDKNRTDQPLENSSNIFVNDACNKILTNSSCTDLQSIADHSSVTKTSLICTKAVIHTDGERTSSKLMKKYELVIVNGIKPCSLVQVESEK